MRNPQAKRAPDRAFQGLPEEQRRRSRADLEA